MKHRMKNTLKSRAIALGLALMLTTLCHGQTDQAGPPHNVIYWDGDETSLQSLVYSLYTDVIVYFVVPDQNCFLSWEGGEPLNLRNSIQALHNAGKTVLFSFGGSDVQSGQYAACYPFINNLVNELSSVMISNGFDGVDIDFEDTSAFQGQAGYDGVVFLTALTDTLYKTLPQWSIITHAPQTPYWSQNYIYNSPPYDLVFLNTGRTEIRWFNNQTYNNCYSGGTDCTAVDKIFNYERIVTQLGVPPIRLVVGLPVHQCATSGCNGDGYITRNDGSNNDVRTVITTLLQQNPARFGGIMGWNYFHDLNDVGGAWGIDIGNALTAWQTSWVGANYATGLCLDSNDSGNAYTSPCNGGNFQNWRFDVNRVRDAQTGRCLDSNDSGNVYTLPCNGGNFQNWEFFDNMIFNRQTRLCLQSDSSGNLSTAPCDVTNINQFWFPHL